MREGPRLRGLPVLGFAALGLLLAHTLAYLVVIPDPHQRAFVLQRTGHVYLPAIAQAALVLAVAGVAAVIVRALASERGRAESFRRLAGPMIVVQVAAFVGQEVLERLLTHTPLVDLLHDHLLLTGIVIQGVVALAGAVLLVQFGRVAARIAASIDGRRALPRPDARLAAAETLRLPVFRALAGPASVRAPPAS